jgi:aquaporin Z
LDITGGIRQPGRRSGRSGSPPPPRQPTAGPLCGYFPGIAFRHYFVRSTPFDAEYDRFTFRLAGSASRPRRDRATAQDSPAPDRPTVGRIALTIPASPEAAMRKYLAELIGTFFLVFTIGITVTTMNSLAPLAIGGVLMVMIYAGGHVSGGHFNPAVTLAVLIRGRISATDATGYVVAQFVGGLLAAVTARWIVSGHDVSTLTLSGRGIATAFAAEALFTLALAYVVLNVATSRSHPVNSFYGLAIGGTVAVGAVTVGSISGGAFNPAVAVSAAAMGLLAWSSIWVQLLAEVIGAAMAAAAFLTLNADDRSRIQPSSSAAPN